jgi:hypothetical protein
MPDGAKLGPDPTLLSHARVEFLNQNMNANEYEALLTRTDLIILPYRQNSYHQRVSRVAIEAAGRGISIIYTMGTWSGEVAELSGCGVAIEDESSEKVAAAILKAAEEIDELKKLAGAGASYVIKYHSTENLRTILS